VSQSLPELVVLAALGPRQRSTAVRQAGPTERLADRVHGLLGHQPEGGQLAAGDRHEAADTISLLVVEQRVRR